MGIRLRVQSEGYSPRLSLDQWKGKRVIVLGPGWAVEFEEALVISTQFFMVFFAVSTVASMLRLSRRKRLCPHYDCSVSTIES